MKNRLPLVIFVVINFFNLNAQLVYNKYDEVLAYSYIDPKIEQIKNRDRINTLELPSYNNDSLFWENNIQFLLPRQGTGRRTLAITRIAGFNIDTTINFFAAASRVRIEHGFLWLYKITSPTAEQLSVRFRDCRVDSADYISAHSNYTDSINGPLEYGLPDVELGPKYWTMEDNNGNGFIFSFLGNILYIEYFSPSKRNLPNIEISGVTYFYLGHGSDSVYRLSDAPKWIRERYPDVNFETGRWY